MTHFVSVPHGFAARSRLWFAIICLVFAPIDVIDFLRDVGSFHLTPFLPLSLLYVVFLLFEQVSRMALGHPPKLLQLFDSTTAVAAIFISSIWISAFFPSADPQNLAISRAAYSTWVILFAILFVSREKLFLPTIIASAFRIFIIFDAIAIVIQLLAVFNGWPLPGLVFGLRILQVAGILRPSGLVADSNACSVLIIFFMGLAFLTRTYLNRGKWVGRGYYAAGVVLILLTISRTGIISLVIFAAIPFMQSKRKLKALGASLLATIVFGGLALLYLQSTKTLSAVVEQAQLVLFSSDQRQESSSIHFQLLAKGTTEFFGNAKTFLLGAGWGTEYDFTKEFFADSKNGNFHNDFISIAVQTGIAGLACFLFLIAKPLLLRMEWKPLTVIVLWSSMFCQYHGNPFWWIAIMIMSTSLASRRRRRGIPMPALSRSGQLVSSSHMVKISIEGS